MPCNLYQYVKLPWRLPNPSKHNERVRPAMKGTVEIDGFPDADDKFRQ